MKTSHMEMTPKKNAKQNGFDVPRFVWEPSKKQRAQVLGKKAEAWMRREGWTLAGPNPKRHKSSSTVVIKRNHLGGGAPQQSTEITNTTTLTTSKRNTDQENHISTEGNRRNTTNDDGDTHSSQPTQTIQNNQDIKNHQWNKTPKQEQDESKQTTDNANLSLNHPQVPTGTHPQGILWDDIPLSHPIDPTTIKKGSTINLLLHINSTLSDRQETAYQAIDRNGHTWEFRIPTGWNPTAPRPQIHKKTWLLQWSIDKHKPPGPTDQHKITITVLHPPHETKSAIIPTNLHAGAPLQDKQWTMADICAGIGGASVIPILAGGTLSLAWDNDAAASNMHASNHNTIQITSDVSLPHKWHKLLGIHMILMGFPCQPFSNVGKKWDS